MRRTGRRIGLIQKLIGGASKLNGRVNVHMLPGASDPRRSKPRPDETSVAALSLDRAELLMG